MGVFARHHQRDGWEQQLRTGGLDQRSETCDNFVGNHTKAHLFGVDSGSKTSVNLMDNGSKTNFFNLDQRSETHPLT